VADNLIRLDAQGTVTTYFYYYNPGVFEGWVTAATFTPSDNVQIPPGSVFLLLRQSGYGAFPWFIPAE
jgi:hypothetical protein